MLLVPKTTDNSKSAIILTALGIETSAVLRHLPEWVEETVDGTLFYCGRFEGWHVAVAEVGAGNASAAAATERAIRHFGPRVALFVGVAGGVKDVALGDVVVANKVYGYESGKEDARGFKSRPEVFRTAHELEQRGRALRQRPDWRQRLNPSVKHGTPDVVVAPIAAGEKVVASSSKATARLLQKLYSDAVAVEMEGRGFLEGVHLNLPVQGAVVRGISDLLDGKAQADKSGSQQRAADAASAAAFEILAGLDGGRAQAAAPAISFLEKPSTFSKGAYFGKGEVLARVGVPDVDQVIFSFRDGPSAYMRVIPGRALPNRISIATLNSAAGHAPLLRSSGFGGMTALNGHGVVLYDPAGAHRGGPADLHLATQLFQNGELWSVSDLIIVRERDFRPAWVRLPFIPAYILEKTFYASAHAAVAFAMQRLGLTAPFQMEFGILGLQGVSPRRQRQRNL